MTQPAEHPPETGGGHGAAGVIVGDDLYLAIDPPGGKLLDEAGCFGQRMSSGDARDDRPAQVFVQMGVNRTWNVGLQILDPAVLSIPKREAAVDDRPVWVSQMRKELLRFD